MDKQKNERKETNTHNEENKNLWKAVHFSNVSS